MKKQIAIILVLSLLLPFAGCKSKKAAVKNTVTTEKSGKSEKSESSEKSDKSDKSKKHQEPTAEELEWKSLVERNQELLTFEANKASVTVRFGSQQFSGKTDIKFIADSVLSFSLQPFLGIELFRIDITQSKLLIVDKLNRQYISMTYSELQKQTGVNLTFKDIESIVKSRLFIVGTDAAAFPISKREYISEGANKKMVRFESGKLSYQYSYDTTNLNPILVTIRQNQAGRTEYSQLEYSLYTMIGQFNLPMQVSASYNSDKLAGSCTLNFSTYICNQTVQISPLNLSRYSQTSLQTLMR